jgi:ferritin-like metal-binding protein YciE
LYYKIFESKPLKYINMKTSSKTGKSRFAEKKTINELFENQLQDIYWAEKELTRFMPQIVKKITSSEVVQVLQEHMKKTDKQIKRLDNIFEILGSTARAEKCEGMEGLMKEAQKITDNTDQGVIMDAFMIGAIQKMEHYEMASYGTLKALATIIGEFEVATLLGETLKEEKEADMKLTDVAENVVNINASREAGELEDEEEDSEEEGMMDEEEDMDEESEDIEDEDEQEEDEYEGRGKSKPRSRTRR